MTEGTLRIPEEVVAALGEDPEREALEALLLHLIRTDRTSVAWAGEKLGLDSVPPTATPSPTTRRRRSKKTSDTPRGSGTDPGARPRNPR